MGKRRSTLSDEIRQALLTCGTNRCQISKATGIDAAVLCRFVQGQRGMTLATLDTLAAFLGLHVVVKRKANKKCKPRFTEGR